MFKWLNKLFGEFGINFYSPFRALTPVDDAEDIESYEEAMDFALSKDRDAVRNIAVTGQYGAGKSSFLRTYFKRRHTNALWVSLALFLEDDDKRAPKPGTAEFEHRLELSILQQIFHVRKDSPWKIIGILVCVILIGVSVVCMVQPDFLVKYVSEDVHRFVIIWSWLIFWGATLLSAAPIAILSYLLLQWIAHLGIKCVGVSGGIGSVEIEMTDDLKNASILNRNIKAIINYFATSDSSIVIFEDIDRFNDVRIFTKLRELNLLLNNSRQIAKKRKPIRFIYALREELFKDEMERTKFFEFIIPIIPRVNTSNSQTELLAFLKNCIEEVDEKFQKLVKDVSPYISDMRLLNNICNEFYTYHRQIVDCTSEAELFGLVIFKNFFPKDFALMHHGDGIIKKLKVAKEKAQGAQLILVDAQIEKITDEITKINNESATSIESLRLRYYVGLMRQFKRSTQVLLHGCWCNVNRIIHTQDWFELLRAGKISGDYEGQIDWRKVEKCVDPECTYDEHVKRVEGRANGEIEKLRGEIQRLRAERLIVRRKTIVELMADDALTEEVLRNEVLSECKEWQDHELFLLLVKNGYLNEQYHYNISVFHEVDGVSSFKDYSFELAVTKGERTDWADVLEKPKEVIENLSVKHFCEPSIMNFSVCRELMKNPGNEKAQEFLRLITQKERNNYEFVNGYLATIEERAEKLRFCGLLAEGNDNYFTELIEAFHRENCWSRDFVEKQLGLFIAWAMKQDQPVTLSASVREFIEETTTMPQLLQENGIVCVDALIDFVAKFNLKFKRLDCVAAKETGFLGVVLAQKAYVFEYDLLKGILDAEGVDVTDFDKKNYSVICRHAAVPEYVDAGFSIYLNAVYLKLKEQQEDDVDNVAKVIGWDELKDEDKDAFLEKQQGGSKIDDVRKLNTTKALAYGIKANWIVPTWANVLQIWNRRNEEGVSLFDFVGRAENVAELAKEDCPRTWDEVKELAKAIVESGALSDDAIKKLLLALPSGVIEDYVGAGASPALVEYLLGQRRVKYSTEFYQNLYAIDNDSHVVLAAMCPKEFCADQEEHVTEGEDVGKILESKLLSKGAWTSVVNVCESWIVKDTDLIKCVARGIDSANYKEIKTSILDVCLEFIDPMPLQCKVILRLGGETEEIRVRLGKMDEPYKQFSLPLKRPLLEPWDGLATFLTFLQDKQIVTKFEEEDGKIRVSTTRG